MPSTRDIRRRIKSVKNTKQITKAMQMVAASKMRKAQQAALAGRPFARLLYRIQRKATTQAVDFSHPLLEVRAVRKRAVILIGADKGLCGALNSNVFRLATQFDPGPEAFLAYLLAHYLDIYLYQVLLNAKASEHSARMVSMKNATDNADGLIKDLTLEYNKLRQGNITKELLDIAGGQAESD